MTGIAVAPPMWVRASRSDGQALDRERAVLCGGDYGLFGGGLSVIVNHNVYPSVKLCLRIVRLY